MERKIGTKFKFEGISLTVAESESDYCNGCFFYESNITCVDKSVIAFIGDCAISQRNDHKCVVFIED